MFTMSPSSKGRLSGIPWQITSFTEVQTDLGNCSVVECGGKRRSNAHAHARGRKKEPIKHKCDGGQKGGTSTVGHGASWFVSLAIEF